MGVEEDLTLLQRLPAWGTTSNGVLYELQTPERLTAARDGSASLPTPTAQDGANNAGPSQWNRNSDPLNVVAVKLGGGSSPLPFNDGNEPSDGPHPHPPTRD